MNGFWFVYNLLPLWAWIIVGLWIYLNLGFVIAKHKYAVFINPPLYPSFWSFIYWPLTTAFNDPLDRIPIKGETTLFWGLFMVWNMLAIMLIGIIFIFKYVAIMVLWVATWGRFKSY